MRTAALPLLLALAPSVCAFLGTSLTACAPAPPPPAQSPVAPYSPAPPASIAPASMLDPPASPAPTSITFIENDYPRALAEARARHVPLFVDTWATWCHTCLSMKSYVFPDPALRPFASRFVWLALDTERAENAPVVTRLAVQSLPTFYVIDPATEAPLVAWPGSLTTPELADLLDDAELASRHGDTGGTAGAELVRARQATASRSAEQAIAAYRAALAAAPSGWPRRPQAVDGLVAQLADTKQAATCVTTGADEAPRMPPGTALADVLREAMGCAANLPPSAPERGRLAELATLGERVAADPSQPILADDRSDLFDYVAHAFRDLRPPRDHDARRVAHTWAAFLEDQAARAPSPATRAVFDAHRLLAYAALGEPERAVPMLEQSARDFPEDYNPPARLGRAFLLMKRYDAALTSTRRAMDLAYGPRKLTLWALEADILEAKKDRAGARDALTQALAYARTVTLTGGYPRLRDALEKRLAKLR